MMHQPAIGDLGRAFRTSAGLAAHLRAFQRQQEEERLRRDRRQDAQGDEAELMDFAMVMVSAGEMETFRVELDSYDTATIAALQENERELAAVRERLDGLLLKAHVLPDGRRVFKTEDGTRVFDEFGHEVEASILAPEEVSDARPSWETYKPELNRLHQLQAERSDLLDYQQKLDEARERIDAGEISREEFDEMRDELKTAMPDAVRAQVPELAAEVTMDADVAAPSLSGPAADTGLAIEDDMIPSSFTPASIPGLTR
ncbi:SHOCT domain-containing protein [Stappia indica]|uniref:SHOCT domain-containing protein n=1 Tax=Stappia indica TaxID=538381 RepID=UPI00082A4AD7|nr:SHOCT domain-containing protein [Stappia indica]